MNPYSKLRSELRNKEPWWYKLHTFVLYMAAVIIVAAFMYGLFLFLYACFTYNLTR